MLLYLTGANSSLAKTSENSQTDPSKSLGGYVSSTVVPNAAINSLFDLISSYTLEKHQPECIAIALINKFNYEVKNITLRIVTQPENEAIFKVAAVALDSKYAMEHIANRYQKPFISEFYDATFERAAVEFEITSWADKGEEILFQPMGVTVEVEESGEQGTWDALEYAFSNDATWRMVKLTDRRFRIVRRDEEIVETPQTCAYISTDNFSGAFKGELKNNAINSVKLNDFLLPGKGIGLWLQRSFKHTHALTNEEILRRYNEHYEPSQVESFDVVIEYEEDNYNDNYNQEKYS